MHCSTRSLNQVAGLFELQAALPRSTEILCPNKVCISQLIVSIC